jgi:hypothetical protein
MASSGMLRRVALVNPIGFSSQLVSVASYS